MDEYFPSPMSESALKDDIKDVFENHGLPGFKLKVTNINIVYNTNKFSKII